MHSQSRTVISNQHSLAPQLRHTRRWRSYTTAEFVKPIGDATRVLFQEIDNRRKAISRPLVLDAGCGNADSSFHLAKRHPNALVLGIERSPHRLARYGISTFECKLHGNVILACMDLIDLWLLAAEHRWRIAHHYLLYPNPWPKRKHWRRRWHAHPAFDAALALGGILELRSNWSIYVEEFAAVLRIKTQSEPRIEQVQAPATLSPFETKYARSGHRLLRLKIALP
tara:strand:+ start:511 stop:1188 length:678 start_codon:yes stop_codon:yes gene_type:complete